MIWTPFLVPAAVTPVACGLVACGLVVLAITSGRGARTARLDPVRGRLDPLLPSAGGVGAALGQAAVYATPLRVRYRDVDGTETETVVVPKSIVGRKAARGVRPDIVNVFCQGRQRMRALRYERIVWAEDALSGDLIEDLHSYLGGAQPGGAPAPLYPSAKQPVPRRAPRSQA